MSTILKNKLDDAEGGGGHARNKPALWKWPHTRLDHIDHLYVTWALFNWGLFPDLRVRRPRTTSRPWTTSTTRKANNNSLVLKDITPFGFFFIEDTRAWTQNSCSWFFQLSCTKLYIFPLMHQSCKLYWNSWNTRDELICQINIIIYLIPYLMVYRRGGLSSGFSIPTATSNRLEYQGSV